MKFNKYFTHQIISEWKYFYTNYYALKTMIKQQESHKFMSLMKNELEKVNSFVSIIRKYDPNNEDLNSYIVMNYMAFFKAIKKYDKKLCKTYKIGFFNMMRNQSFYNVYINSPRECDKIKLVIFDKDGTLINHDKLFVPWLKQWINNIKPILPENKDIYKHLGFNENDNTFSFDSIIPKGTNDDMRNSITEFIVKNTNKDINTVRTYVKQYWVDIDFDEKDLETYGNLVNIFTKLRKMNIKVAICTSDDRNPTEKMIEITGIKDLLDLYVCGNDPISSKPSPCGFFKYKPETISLSCPSNLKNCSGSNIISESIHII